MKQRLQTMARPGEADGAGWLNVPLAEGPQVFSSPRRLPSVELLITSESMHAFNALAATPLIDAPVVQWDSTVLAACAGAASPPRLAAGPQKRKVLPPAGWIAKFLHPAPGTQKHHATRFPEVELRRSETLSFACTDIDFTYPYATAGVMSKHDIAVMSTHAQLWSAMFQNRDHHKYDLLLAQRGLPVQVLHGQVYQVGLRPGAGQGEATVWSTVLHSALQGCTAGYAC